MSNSDAPFKNAPEPHQSPPESMALICIPGGGHERGEQHKERLCFVPVLPFWKHVVAISLRARSAGLAMQAARGCTAVWQAALLIVVVQWNCPRRILDVDVSRTGSPLQGRAQTLASTSSALIANCRYILSRAQQHSNRRAGEDS